MSEVKFYVSPTVFIKEFKLSADKGRDSFVPCGECVACCMDPAVDIDLLPGEDATQYETFEKSGRHMLKRQPDGRCVYLIDNLCTIYDRRPKGCRTFDCRLLVVAGIHSDTLVNKAADARFRLHNKKPKDATLRKVLLFALGYLGHPPNRGLYVHATKILLVGWAYLKGGIDAAELALRRVKAGL